MRKKENLHALYSMLEYCEEPYLCRRMMQLQFLGEVFDQSHCMRMCDNCKTGKRIDQKDMTHESRLLASCVQEVNESRGKITVK